jgi:hypothetical protein
MEEATLFLRHGNIFKHASPETKTLFIELILEYELRVTNIATKNKMSPFRKRSYLFYKLGVNELLFAGMSPLQ